MTRIHYILATAMVTFFLFLPTVQAQTPTMGDEVQRAEAYVDAVCRCMFDNYKPATPEAPGMRICTEQANAKYSIPENVEETFTVQVGPTKVTHPKLFSSKEANERYAEKHQACLLKFSLAVQDYQSRKWSDSICMSQCRDEGDQKNLCRTICMEARLPTPEVETTAPKSCDEQCEHLNGRSKRACTRKCKKKQGK